MKYFSIKSQLKKVYDDLAVYWGQDFSLHDWGIDRLQKFAGQVKGAGGRKVLDLGCGSGVQSELLAKEGLEVVGLDLSPTMIREAKKRIPAGRFIVGDITRLGFDDETFDGVYARAVLLHIPKKLIPKVLKSIFKILKSGGYFYLAVKKGIGESEIEDERHRKKVKRFFSFFEESELEELLREVGFTGIEISTHQRVEGSTIWIEVLAIKAP